MEMLRLSVTKDIEALLVKHLGESIPVRFVSAGTLIRIKEAVGRPQDLADIENLRLRLEHDAAD
jgi:hypothetical protein